MSYRLDTDKTWHETYTELGRCMQQWGIRNWSAEANVPSSRMNSRSLQRDERAVTVHYEKGGHQVVLSLDTQISPAMNLRAIYLCLDAMRLIDKRGLGDIAGSAYMQLAAPASARDPYEVLGLRPGASKEDVEAMYRVRAKAAHPDGGGSDEAMAELNAARDRVLAEVRQ